MTFDYKQMLADREAGTQGDFTFNGSRMIRASGKALAVIVTPHGNTASDKADGRRIASIPDMEAEIIRLREVLEKIASGKTPSNLEYPIRNDWTGQAVSAVLKARAALKGDDQ